MTAISKNVHFDVLDDIVNKYNNTVHRTIKMKPIDVNSVELQSKKEVNDKDPKFKFEDCVRISKYKNIFAKGYMPNWSEEVYSIKKKLKIQFHGHMVLMILMVKKFQEHFIKKNCRRLIKNEFRTEKVIRKRRWIICQIERS